MKNPSLPGQGFSLHFSILTTDPSQSFPPFWAIWDLDLSNIWIPPPQGLVQLPLGLKLPQVQSTERE